MTSGWNDWSAFNNNNNNGLSLVGVELDGALLEAVQQIRHTSGNLQNDDLLLGIMSGHNSDVEHSFAWPEMYTELLL